MAADSTGHGVPGAIMSILNISALDKALENGITHAGDILNFARTEIINRLKNDGTAEGGKDGMDAALIILDRDKMTLEFALANNPLWLIRNSELIEYKGEKMPVGKHDKQNQPFTRTKIELQKNDLIYIFTDGYADQFGGEKIQILQKENKEKNSSIPI
ncbi:MAG: SpoIIE family protein phosphatase [Crocinitomicaceae bacterium]|nr:SpoIIE family protein phosphatase [Crocinitomicaceae bacterium]